MTNKWCTMIRISYYALHVNELLLIMRCCCCCFEGGASVMRPRTAGIKSRDNDKSIHHVCNFVNSLHSFHDCANSIHSKMQKYHFYSLHDFKSTISFHFLNFQPERTDFWVWHELEIVKSIYRTNENCQIYYSPP